MKVVENKQIKKLPISDLLYGDAFLYEDRIYLYCCPVGSVKNEEENTACVVDLTTGLIGTFSCRTMVEPIDASVFYTKKRWQ